MPRVTIKLFGTALQSKHVMWSLYVVCKFVVINEQYATLSWKTMVGEELLGVGSMLKRNTEALPLDGDTARASALDKLGLPSGELSSQTEIYNSTLSESKDPLGDGKSGIRLNIEWPRKGANFLSHEVLYSIMKLMIDVAELPLNEGNPGITWYNTDGDMQLIICPRNQHAVADLTNKIIVFTLVTLAEAFAQEGAGGRWSEFKSEVRWYGKIVGTAVMIKGNPFPSCEAAPSLQVGSTVEVLSAGDPSSVSIA